MMGLPMLENLARADTDDRIRPMTATRPAWRGCTHPAWGRLRGPGPGRAGRRDIVITMLPDSAVTNAVIEARGAVQA